MPRSPIQPSYRYHKARNCAVVTLGGKNFYLGRYNSPESHEEYARLITEWRRNGAPPPVLTTPASQALSVSDLILAYFLHVQAHYVKNGKPTSEQDNIRQALRFVRQLYGSSPAADFGSKALKNVREEMIAAGRCRKLINKDVHRIRALYRWAVEEELLPVEVHARLMRVRGLRKGASAARESPKVKPVPVKHVKAVLPHLPPQVAAMARVQLLSGARPQEITSLRPCEITVTDEGVWYYQPGTHKMQHMDRDKVIVLGPRAQRVLRPWLDRDPECYCFVPAEASAWQLARRRKAADGIVSSRPASLTRRARSPGKQYTRHSYRNCIRRACRRANVPVWSPRQLRHTRATMIRKRYGSLEAAKAVLGHADTKITELYAERDLDLATKVMREIG
jgi:integrase